MKKRLPVEEYKTRKEKKQHIKATKREDNILPVEVNRTERASHSIDPIFPLVFMRAQFQAYKNKSKRV